MFIEKSPFYQSKNLDNEKILLSKNQLKKNNEGSTFSFLKWIKGAINPLQNLPLISGIYSSINSGNKDSDRDMVQNGLGGFLYGGPIGAIAGVGNWIFNKLFDNTPTELFLEFTGISKIWKEKENTEVANLNDQKKIIKTNKHAPLADQENNSKEELRNISPDKKSFESNHQNSKVYMKNSRILEFNYPQKNFKEDLDRVKESKIFNFSQTQNYYNINKDIEEVKNSLNIKA